MSEIIWKVLCEVFLVILCLKTGHLQYISFCSVSGGWLTVLAMFWGVSHELGGSAYMMIQQCSPQAFFNSFHYPFYSKCICRYPLVSVDLGLILWWASFFLLSPPPTLSLSLSQLDLTSWHLFNPWQSSFFFYHCLFVFLFFFLLFHTSFFPSVFCPPLLSSSPFPLRFLLF